MRNLNKVCGTCYWHEHEAMTDGWICINNKSDHCTDWTNYDDTCDEWEAKQADVAHR